MASYRRNRYRKWKTGKRERAGVLMIDKDSDSILLVLQKLSHCWGIPKGGVEAFESYIDCAKREVKEETGFDISDIIKESECIFNKIKSNKCYVVYVDMLNYQNFCIQDTLEISDVRWIKLSEIDKYKLNSATKYVIKNK